MRKRILGLLPVFTLIAVLCSLQFGGTGRGPVDSVLAPLLPAQASADNYWCGNNAYCPQPYSACATFENPSSICQHDYYGGSWHCENVPDCD